MTKKYLRMRNTRARVRRLTFIFNTSSPVFDLSLFSTYISQPEIRIPHKQPKVAIPCPDSPAHQNANTTTDLDRKPRSSRARVEEVRGAEGSEVEGAGQREEEQVAPAEAVEE